MTNVGTISEPSEFLECLLESCCRGGQSTFDYDDRNPNVGYVTNMVADFKITVEKISSGENML